MAISQFPHIFSLSKKPPKKQTKKKPHTYTEGERVNNISLAIKLSVLSLLKLTYLEASMLVMILKICIMKSSFLRINGDQIFRAKSSHISFQILFTIDPLFWGRACTVLIQSELIHGNEWIKFLSSNFWNFLPGCKKSLVIGLLVRWSLQLLRWSLQNKYKLLSYQKY